MNIIGIILLATLIEGTLTYLFGDNSNAPAPRPWIKYVSLALGVVVAIAYRIDIPAMAGLASEFTYASFIVSGLIIGRGANYINDIVGLIKGQTKS